MEYKTLQDLIKNEDFVRTLMQYEEDRGMEPSNTPLEAAQNFLSDYRYLQSNTVGAYDFVNYVKGIDDSTEDGVAYKQNLGRLYKAVDEEVDQIFSEEVGWGETMQGIREYAQYAVLDPINLLGIGVGKSVAMGVARPVINRLVSQSLAVKATEGLAKAQTSRLGRAALSGAGAFAIDAPISAGMEVATQEAEKELDVREDFSGTEIAAAGLIGGAVASVPAGIVGAVTDPTKKVREIQQTRDALLEETEQGQAAKKESIAEYGQKDRLRGLYVETTEGTKEAVSDEYDSMGHIVDVDNNGDVVVEYIAKDFKNVEEPRIRVTLKQEDVKALSQKDSDQRAKDYLETHGKFFDPKSIQEGKEEFIRKSKELGAGDEEVERMFAVSLDPDMMVKVNNAVNDMIAQDPDLLRYVDKRARVSEKAAAILERTPPDKLPENIRMALDKNGLTQQQFADVSRADASIAGFTLGKQSKLDFKALKNVSTKAEALSDQDLQRIAQDRITQALEDQAQGKFGAAVDVWRSLLVVQPATTARNIAGSTALLPGEMLRSYTDKLFRTFDLKLQGIDPETVDINPIDRNHFQILRRLANPEESAMLMRMLAGEFKEIDDKILNLFDDRLGKVGEDDSAVYKFFNALSRYGNTFNRIQDHGFKSAAFLTDLDRQVKISRDRGLIPKNITGIEDILATNKMEYLTDEMVSRAVEFSYKLTFQNRRAGDRLIGAGGLINKAQQVFDKYPAFKLVVPFPNFLANSVVYILNRMGMGAFKTLYRGRQISKSLRGKAVESTAKDRARLKELNDLIKEETDNSMVREYKEQKLELLQKFGEQEKRLEDFKDGIVETVEMGALLGAALALRATQGGGEWYQIKDTRGEDRDFRPLFPLAPFLFMADCIIRTYNETPMKKGTFNEGLEALFGVSARSGVLGTAARELQKIVERDDLDTETQKKIGQGLGNLFGYYLGGLSTPLRPIEDVIKTVGGQETREYRDRRQVENILEKYGFFSEEATAEWPKVSGFIDEVVKNVVQGTPFEREFSRGIPQLRSPFTGEVRQASPVQASKQIYGASPMGKISDVQEELARVGYNTRSIPRYTSTPEYDNIYNMVLGYETASNIRRLIYSDQYRNLESDALKKLMLEEAYKDLKTQVSEQMKTLAPVLSNLQKLENDYTLRPFLAQAITLAKETNPNFSLRYVDEKANPEQAKILNENIDAIRYSIKSLRERAALQAERGVGKR